MLPYNGKFKRLGSVTVINKRREGSFLEPIIVNYSSFTVVDFGAEVLQ